MDLKILKECKQCKNIIVFFLYLDSFTFLVLKGSIKKKLVAKFSHWDCLYIGKLMIVLKQLNYLVWNW